MNKRKILLVILCTLLVVSIFRVASPVTHAATIIAQDRIAIDSIGLATEEQVEVWDENVVLGPNVPEHPFAGVYEYDTLIIKSDVIVTSSGISHLVIKVNKLVLEDNASIRVRNGYYNSPPSKSIKNLTSSDLYNEAIYYNGVFLLPNYYGKGGDGGDGGDGQLGRVYQVVYGVLSVVPSGSGGGGGGGGYGGGMPGKGGQGGRMVDYGKPVGATRHLIAQAGSDGMDGRVARDIYATAIGSHGYDGWFHGDGGSGGWSNGGIGGETGWDASLGAGGGKGGGGGGGGGYGGGVLTIIADEIVYEDSSKLLVSGQRGGLRGHNDWIASSYTGYDGQHGEGGLLIIETNSTLNENLWTLGTTVLYDGETENNGGHGRVTGDPQAVFINVKEVPNVRYRTHVQNVGWQGWKRNGEASGTSGQSLRLEGMYIEIEDIDNAIEYRTHVQNIGWQDWVSDGEMTGTSGRSLRLEAIDIRLKGNAAKHYDIYYRVHAQNFGWMDWAKNGASAGTAGYSYRLEAIEIVLVEKGGAAPGPTTTPFKDKNSTTPVTPPVNPPSTDDSVKYQTHVQNVGWQGWKHNGDVAGTSGKSLRLEGMYIEIVGQDNAIEYRTHVQNIGWQDWVSDGEMTGTSGRSLRLEAIDIRLTGQMAAKYDIYYRVHAQNVGWMDWAKNGQSAGTAGFSYRLEAIQIVIVEKGGAAPGPTSRPFISAYAH